MYERAHWRGWGGGGGHYYFPNAKQLSLTEVKDFLGVALKACVFPEGFELGPNQTQKFPSNPVSTHDFH